ncbi:hypothetical protein GCM10029978_109990 [Actinoallomurus acanthiterrae]
MDITPETVDKAAGNFAVGQQDLMNAYQKLSQRLQAASSMAGDDKAAHQFATVYQPAAQAAYQAFHTAIEALGGTSLGLTHTINNHLAADHHSRADKPAGPPPRYPQHQVSTSFAVAGSPPVVTGFNWAPSTTVPRLRVKVPQLPGWVASAIGDSPNWPQGNDHLLDEAGNAWQEAAQEIGKVASWLDGTISTILDPADNTEHAAVSNYWASLYKPGDSTTVLSGLFTMCQALGGACHDYAATTRKAADIVAAETIAEIIILLGAEFAGRLIGRALRPVLARVGAFMLRSVTRIAARYVLRDILADLTSAIANTKIVKAVQAAFDKTAGKVLEKDITEGLAPTEFGSNVGREATSMPRGEKTKYLCDKISQAHMSQEDAAKAADAASRQLFERVGGQQVADDGRIVILPAKDGNGQPVIIVDRDGRVMPGSADLKIDWSTGRFDIKNLRAR